MPSTSSQPFREKVAVGVYRRVTRTGAIRFEYAYTDKAGKQRWGTTTTKREAKRLRAVMNGKRPEERVAPSRELFRDVAEQWWQQKRPKLRPSTQEDYRAALDLVLLPRFGSWRVAMIDADAVVNLIRDLEREGLHAVDPKRPVRPLGWSSVSNYCKPLQQSLAFAARRGWISVSPFSVMTSDDRPSRSDVERKRAHEWTSGEIEALLSASRRLAANSAARYDYSPLLLLAVTLGLRLGECLGLQWRDLERDEDGSYVLHVRRQWLRSGEFGLPKTRAGARVVAVPSDLAGELLALKLRSRYSGDEDPLFASRLGRPLQHRNATLRGFEAARDEAKLSPDLTFHDLRHAAASRLIASGLDDVIVADQIGHGDSRITRAVYSHVFDRREKMDAVRSALAGVAARSDDREATFPGG